MTDFDMSKLMQQAQQMREKMEYMQKGLAEQVVDGSAGAGMVTAKVNGALKVVGLQIDPSVMEEDPEMLQDLVIAAMNNALEKARNLAQEQLGSLVPPGTLPPNMFG